MTTVLRVKGLPLTRAPAFIDEDGYSVFHLSDRVDVWDAMNAARAQIFPGVKLPAVDKVFDGIMRAKVERDAAAQKERRGG